MKAQKLITGTGLINLLPELQEAHDDLAILLVFTLVEGREAILVEETIDRCRLAEEGLFTCQVVLIAIELIREEYLQQLN